MIIQKISSGKIEVTNASNETVILKKNDTVVVTDDAGQGFLNNYPQHFAKVETQGEVDEKATKKQAELEAKVAELTEKLEEKISQETQVVELTEQLEALQTKFDSETTTLGNQVKELETQVALLKDEKEALQTTLSGNEKTTAHLEETVDRLQTENEALITRNAELEANALPSEDVKDAEVADGEVVK